jgi:hypothetical protein
VQLNSETYEQFITDEVRDKLIADANKYGMGFGFMHENGYISVIENDRVIVVKINHGTDEGSVVSAVIKAETQDAYAEGQQPQQAGEYQRVKRTPPVSYAFPISESAMQAFDILDRGQLISRIRRTVSDIIANRDDVNPNALCCFINAAYDTELFQNISVSYIDQPGWEKIARIADAIVANAVAPSVFKGPYELLAS